MSTGQRQRVKLAQAIAPDPRLVLLDEPTDGLDPVQRDHMLALIRRIGTEFDIDVVLSSHLLDEVERVCDHAVILNEGSVVAHGSISDLLGGSAGLVIEMDEDATATAAALRSRNVTVAADGRTLRLEPADGVDLVATANLVLAESGAGVRRMHESRRSLEDVFLGVTG
jgi:ABC-2 type transport system ATP-binding protein